MENQTKNNTTISELLTHKRFELGHTEVKKRILELKNDGLIDQEQFEKISNEDIVLKIKYRTYKKSLQKIGVGLFLIAIGVVLMSTSSYGFLLLIFGIIISMSSFFGIVSNKLTKIQKEYLKN